MLFWLELSHLHLTWCSSRSLFFVQFTEGKEKGFNLLFFCHYCYLVLFFCWPVAFLRTVITVFLNHLFSMLNKPNSCHFCHWSHISSSSAHCCCCLWLFSCLRSFLYEPCLYGLMISCQGRQLYLSPFKSALWDSNFSFSRTMGLEKWWSESPH